MVIHTSIRSLMGFGNPVRPLALSVLYHSYLTPHASPRAISGENQLSPGSIGISPLSTPHPTFFQQRPVRASTRLYSCFTLDMDRSPGFGSTSRDSFALFRLAFAAAPRSTRLTSPRNVSRRFILQKARDPAGFRHDRLTVCKHAVSGSFDSPPGGSFHLSLTVLDHYRSREDVFSLG